MLCFYFQLAICIGIIHYLYWLLRYVIVDALFSREIRGKTILVIGSLPRETTKSNRPVYPIQFQDSAMILWWNVFEGVLLSLPAVNQHRHELNSNSKSLNRQIRIRVLEPEVFPKVSILGETTFWAFLRSQKITNKTYFCDILCQHISSKNVNFSKKNH